MLAHLNVLRYTAVVRPNALVDGELVLVVGFAIFAVQMNGPCGLYTFCDGVDDDLTAFSLL